MSRDPAGAGPAGSNLTGVEVLSPVQVRILGCLLEKERATPDSYPLTMNSLLLACNQTTNRYPVVSLNEPTVSSALANLRAAGLIRVVYSRSNRAERYRQVLDEVLGLSEPDMALLAMLMVRGPQTAAELRTRAERLYPFDSVAEVEKALEGMGGREDGLVTVLERGRGQKEPRWAHLLGGSVAADELESAGGDTARGGRADRVSALEDAVTDLRAEIERLRADHDSLTARLADLLA